MASARAREIAALAWCTPETENIEMDPVLGEAFADIVDGLTSELRVGLATTRELLEELTARIEVTGKLDYRTVDDPRTVLSGSV